MSEIWNTEPTPEPEPGDAVKSLLEATPSTESAINSLHTQIGDLNRQIGELKGELDKRNVLDSLSATAKELKIPAAVIEHDLSMYAGQFTLTDGKLTLATDPEKSAKDVLASMQKERPHWQPVSRGGSDAWDTPVRATSDAHNLAIEVQRQVENWFSRNN